MITKFTLQTDASLGDIDLFNCTSIENAPGKKGHGIDLKVSNYIILHVLCDLFSWFEVRIMSYTCTSEEVAHNYPFLTFALKMFTRGRFSSVSANPPKPSSNSQLRLTIL